MYTRKTRDVYTLQGCYGPRYGWEDLTAETTRPDIRAQWRAYRENEPSTPLRIIVKRVPL